MLMNLKQWLCEYKGPEYDHALPFGNVRLGGKRLFWKNGLKLYRVELDTVRRAYRQEESVYGRLCCGGRSFIIEWLVLVRSDGSELVLHIGDDVKKQAEALLEGVKHLHPQIQYGKV